MAAHQQLDFDWLKISSGPFMLGVEPWADVQPRHDEGPQHLVELAGFRIARTPVTNAQYAAFVAASGHRPPEHWEGATPPAWLAQHPVTYVDWQDARAFCAWAGVRLPSEAEWEKAARGTDGRSWPWGALPPDALRCNYAGQVGAATPVGSYAAGASPYGALDMAGNVWEWTASLHRAYPYDAGDGREDSVATGQRAVRGGSFNHAAAELRCSDRGRLYADACDVYIGFRVAASHNIVIRPIAFDWLAIPAGPFLMGADEMPLATAADDRPAQPGLGQPRQILELPTFQIARTPVTNAQYAAFVATSGYRPPDQWQGATPPDELAQHPVTYVSWQDAQAFCAWAGARLPGEAEWEKAARGTDGRRYPWGEESPDATLAHFDQAADGLATGEVGSCPAGASPYGALDMAGNVWEWTASLHRAYPYDAGDGREDSAAPGQRVLRGGSGRSGHERYLRCAFRSLSYPSRRRDHIGFRVAALKKQG